MKAFCIPFKGFPLPPHHALACPVCETFKMYPVRLAEIDGFKCAGPDCGHVMARVQVEQFIGMMMVEE